MVSLSFINILVTSSYNKYCKRKFVHHLAKKKKTNKYNIPFQSILFCAQKKQRMERSESKRNMQNEANVMKIKEELSL